MIGLIISGLIFSTSIIVLSISKPEGCRIFLGISFLLLGLVVNLSLVFTQPFFVYEFGMVAWLPLFRSLTESFIGLNPILFGVFFIVFEVLVGLALLSKKNWVYAGIFLASLFILILTPLYYSQIAWSLSLFGVLPLLRKKYDNNVVDIIRLRHKKAS